MTDERLGLDLARWMKDAEFAPPDPSSSAHQVAARLPQTRQLGRRWWLPSYKRMRTNPPAADRTTEYQPSPVPATNGQTPTVIGRTTSMLSPVKAITAGALVFAVGGAFLIAQPFQQQASVPGAESADFVEPVEFTAVLTPGPWVSNENCENIGGMRQCRGQAWTPDITEVSDPRLDGEMTLSANINKWPGQPMLSMETYRITNEDGAWQGSFPSVYESFDQTSGAQSVVLVGEGDYEGLYAWMDVTDWSAVSGVIFSYPPPEAPAPPSTE
jgi:hypothetical protein